MQRRRLLYGGIEFPLAGRTGSEGNSEADVSRFLFAAAVIVHLEAAQNHLSIPGDISLKLTKIETIEGALSGKIR